MDPWCGADNKWVQDVLNGENIPYKFMLSLNDQSFVCKDALRNGALLYVTRFPEDDPIRKNLVIGKRLPSVVFRIPREECPI